MKKLFWIFLFLFSAAGLHAQYPPAAGQPGSTALASDSSLFLSWATGCVTQRGFMDISNPSLGAATYGADTAACGLADNNVVSLGDSGSAVLTFSCPIVNGGGYDFAVFENGMMDTYLELAFVEVSSDGIHYVRFPSVSLTQDTSQVGGFGLLDCTRIHNLAGKYRVFFGTPFDLDDISDSAGIDLNSITHVRIRDVVGCIQSPYATRDGLGHVINDPWNTPFASGGFDLDAVGVIHNTQNPGGVEELNPSCIRVFPNPSCDGKVHISAAVELNAALLYDLSGREIFSQKLYGNEWELNLSISNGVYLLRIQGGERPVTFSKLIISR